MKHFQKDVNKNALIATEQAGQIYKHLNDLNGQPVGKNEGIILSSLKFDMKKSNPNLILKEPQIFSQLT